MADKKIGLVLSGGGARGFSHVGALKVFAEYGITFDMVAGTSAGSIVGAAVAAGMNIQEILAMTERITWLGSMRPSFSLRGLLSTAPMAKFLSHELPVTRFEDLKLPFGVVTYDLNTDTEVVFSDTGDLIQAVRASCAVPGIFMPIRDNERLLVDGGVTSPIPIDVMWQMGADVVIGVDVLACGATFRATAGSAVSVLVRSALAMIRNAAKAQKRQADITIEPAIAHLRPDQLGKRQEFVALGEAAARLRIDEIIALIR